MPGPAPDFYLGAMSPYSWLAAERIGGILPSARWRAVFLGGVFRATGGQSWGLTDRREAEMAECERRAAAYGLGALSWPESWPTNDLTVARAMTFAAQTGMLESLALEAMRLAFLEGEDLASEPVVLEAGRRAGITEGVLARAIADERVKLALRETTDGALARGLCGVPTVAVGAELFWGDDRLEEAAAAAGAVAGPRG